MIQLLIAAAMLASPLYAADKPKAAAPKTETAIFAGGCFWCMQPPFDKLPGVLSTTAGYTGGKKDNPTYEEVSSGTTGHAESLKIEFDPSKVSYSKLLDVFWRNIDPTTPDQQFCDTGDQYRSAIFYLNDSQKKAALESKTKYEKLGVFKKPVVTQIVAASKFYPAEEHHQNYYKKNPVRYRFYRNGCGRDQRLQEIWGDDAAKWH